MRWDLKPEAEHFCQLCFQLNIELLFAKHYLLTFSSLKPDLLRKTEQEAYYLLSGSYI